VKVKELDMKTLRLWTIALVLLIVGNAATVFAQSDRGTIRGTVTDPAGAIVPNAKVVLNGLETGETRETTTSEDGFYTFPELRPAVYQITVEAQGFQRTTLENFKVSVQTTHTANIELQLGAMTTEVTVQAEGETLQTETPVRQTNVTERQVKELPLQVSAEAGGRTPLAFIFLDSNVTSTGEGSNTGDRAANASRFRVSGGQALGTEILIDGAATRRAQNGTFFSEVAPGPNAFQEFTISTSTFSAEFGNTSGGVVNFRLKSGTNDFHGEVYELYRNAKLNANSFRNNAEGIMRPQDTQHDFGFNIGGPVVLPGFGEGTPYLHILRNRTFFFFNYEGYRFTRSETVNVSVPTERMRLGDFGELLTDPAVLSAFPGGVQIFNPRSGSPGNKTPFANNIIPQSAIDPAGFRILQMFPRPTRAGVFRNYTASSTVPTSMNNSVFKIDHNINNDQRVSVSYSYRQLGTLQGGFPRFPSPFVAFGRWDQVFTSHLARVQHDYNITPNFVNHFNYGFTRYNVVNANTTIGFDPFSLGIPTGSLLGGAFPAIDFPGYGDQTDPIVNKQSLRSYQGIGSTFFNDLPFADNTHQFSDFVTAVFGRHTLRIGGDLRFQVFKPNQVLAPGGWFNFRHNQTANNNDDQGWPIASLITGSTEFAFNSSKTIEPEYRYFYPAVFVQDDFKATQKLTLNLGIRYEIINPRTEAQGRLRSFDPEAINPEVGRPGALVAANGQGALKAKHPGIAPGDKSAIGPRVGAAYALNNKTVLRGGIGLYYSPVLYGIGGSNIITEGAEGYNTFTVYPQGGFESNIYLSSFPARPSTNPNNQFIGGDVTYFDPNFKAGRTLQYSLDVQRELPYNFVASIGYIGHRADRLRSNFERVNALPLNALRLGPEILNAPLGRITNPANAADIAFANAARAYAQTVGVTLPTSRDAVYPGFNGPVRVALRPFPQYNRINNALESQGTSEYNALQVKLERRFAQGVQFNASYTFSRLITDASEDLFGGSPLGQVLQNPYDRSSLKTESAGSIPHVFVVSYIAELPFGKGRRFLNKGGILDRIVGGWQISGIHRYQSGAPLAIYSRRNTGFLTDIFNIGSLNAEPFLRPNLTGQPILTNNQAQGLGFQQVNPAAFSQPPDYGANPAFLNPNGTLNPAYSSYYADPLRFFGNAPPVLADARGLPFLSENLSLLKKTRITETVTFEARAEVFNVFNRHRYNGPDNNMESGNFGFSSVVNDYNVFAPRSIQLGLRLIF